MQAVTLAVSLALAGWCRGQGTSHIPSPDVLKYDRIEGDDGYGFGIYNIYTDSCVLDRNAELIKRWAGDVTSSRINFKFERVKQKLCSAQTTHIDRDQTPEISKNSLKLNISKPCNITQIPDRFITDNQFLMPLKRTIKKKRQSSWLDYIGQQGTIQSGPDPEDWVSQYVKNPHLAPRHPQQDPKPNFPVDTNRFGVSEPDSRSWLSYIGGSWPDRGHDNTYQGECGKAAIVQPLILHGKPTLAGQWPWQIGLYQNKHFICGGTLVSRQQVITAAHCVTHENSRNLVHKNTLSVYLGIHNLRTITQGVQTLNVENIVIHPQYNGLSFAQDISVLKLAGSVQITNFVRPACLWPDSKIDLGNVIGKTGIVVGWGQNENRVLSEELALVYMPIVSQEECRNVNSLYETSRWGTTFCAGVRDDTTACYGDSGSGMVVKMDDTWYLRGLVSLTVNDCDPLHYIIFTDVAKFLPWIKENM